MVIGGENLYAQMLPLADCLYLTFVEAEIEGGDTYFPVFPSEEWEIVQEELFRANAENIYDFRIVLMQRLDSA
jgi:dihydrofolate reductase